MPKKSCLRKPFDKQHGEHAQTVLRSESEHLYQNHWSMPSQLSWKTSLWLTCQIFWLLVNTFAANEKYPVLTRDNLAIPIQMQLSQKQKTFSQFFTAFLKFRLNFKYFEQKNDPHRFFNVEITDTKKVVR